MQKITLNDKKPLKGTFHTLSVMSHQPAKVPIATRGLVNINTRMSPGKGLWKWTRSEEVLTGSYHSAPAGMSDIKYVHF